MNTKLLNEKEITVILQILKNGPQNQYQLQAGINRYATVQATTKQLAEKKLITLKEEDSKKTWGLTIEGFCHAMNELQDREMGLSETEFETMINSWGELAPLIQLLPEIKVRISLDEAVRFIKFAAAKLIRNQSSFRGETAFAGPIIFAFLDDFKMQADSARFFEKHLKEAGVFDLLANDAAALGLKADLSNINEAAKKLIESEKWNSTKRIVDGDLLGPSFRESAIDFFVYLGAKRNEHLLVRWLPIFKELPLLNKIFCVYVEETEEKVTVEANWLKKIQNT